MIKSNVFLKELTNGKVQRSRLSAAIVLACSLILGLLPGFVAAQDLPNREVQTTCSGTIVPLEGPVLAGKPVTFSVKGNLSNPHWDMGDGAMADGSSLSHTFEKSGIYRVVM